MKAGYKRGGQKYIDQLIEDHSKATIGLQVVRNSIPHLLKGIGVIHKLAESRPEDGELIDGINMLEDAFMTMCNTFTAALGVNLDDLKAPLDGGAKEPAPAA